MPRGQWAGAAVVRCACAGRPGALGSAFAKLPSPVVNVENTIVEDNPGPQTVDFKRNPNGSIKSATVTAA